jgi:hypothetical protein
MSSTRWCIHIIKIDLMVRSYSFGKKQNGREKFNSNSFKLLFGGSNDVLLKSWYGIGICCFKGYKMELENGQFGYKFWNLW